ncbi:hypothetical protein DHEL01_v210076 [Diaporthe helianthi]|uniref:Uncharacterized protein n=1 Tax=Diaporthe helianthi TaxID=158607 RepID=A0A2P5HMQ1_DIAHE|nr:hypothetical protein DHEL01_v210076 [Diaporthe helianthi]
MQASITRFPLYPELPVELRLKIIEEAVATRIKDARHRSHHTADLTSWAASIHSDWNQVIERVLFKNITITPEEIQAFARICGKRQGHLRKLSLVFELEAPSTSLLWGTLPERPDQHTEIVNGVSQLFHALKDWSPAERPTGLLQLSISIFTCPGQRVVVVHSDTCTFNNLPQVPIIGRLHVDVSPYFIWSHHSAHALHKKLPNLRGAQLALPNPKNPQHAITRARIRIAASHSVNPHLAKLSITQDRQLGLLPVSYNRSNQIRIARSLASDLSLWRTTLVCLKLNCSIDPPRFLYAARASRWTNLHRLDLVGTLDDADIPDAKAWDSDLQARAYDNFLQGLIACLPSMPSLMRLSMRFLRGWKQSVLMDLGTTGKNTEGLVSREQPSSSCSHRPSRVPVTPCGRFTTDGGILKAHGIALSGPLVTKLQDTVWQHRGLDLDVFCCSENLEDYILCPPCVHWNKETEIWEPAFFNEMDPFVYAMGEYWRHENL